MMRALLLCTLLSGGCFDWPSLSSGPVAHLATDDAFAGQRDVLVDTDHAIDTTALTINPPVDGVQLTKSGPAGAGGPELAVLRVAHITVAAGATMQVTGARPLVIIVGDSASIDGLIDAGAHGPVPGPGGGGPNEGPGAGRDGTRRGAEHTDSGGSGGSFGEVGGAGGSSDDGVTVVLEGPGAAAAYGDPTLPILQGGSGGGAGAPDVCQRMPGGAGGGALQISAANSIRVGPTGKINAGGGGGRPGAGDPDCLWGGAGSGGGSGGAILLQASRIDNQGAVSANGGGGGASASYNQEVGTPGQDGAVGSVSAAGGVRIRGAGGGSGGAAMSPAQPGITSGQLGGGGGGAVGRVRVLSDDFASPPTNFSPRASTGAFRGP